MSLGLENFDQKAEREAVLNAGYLAGLLFIKTGEMSEHTFKDEQAALWQQGFDRAQVENKAAKQIRHPEPDQAGRIEE